MLSSGVIFRFELLVVLWVFDSDIEFLGVGTRRELGDDEEYIGFCETRETKSI